MLYNTEERLGTHERTNAIWGSCVVPDNKAAVVSLLPLFI